MGITNDSNGHFVEHNNGYNKRTKTYLPFKMIYKEGFQTRMEARTKEKYLKSGIGREFLKRIV
jgi:putative endonuclease